MKTYIVLYRDDSLKPLDPPLGFKCQADNGDHAEEQCINAYPNCDVVWVVEDCNNIDDAYVNYYDL